MEQTISGSFNLSNILILPFSNDRILALTNLSRTKKKLILTSHIERILIILLKNTWRVTTLAGQVNSRGDNDGKGSEARFSRPRGIAIDKQDNIYVCEWNNNTVRKISSDGVVVTLAGHPGHWGSRDGVGSKARFNGPSGLGKLRTYMDRRIFDY